MAGETSAHPLRPLDEEHLLGIYDTDAFRIGAVVDYVRPAIERGAITVVYLSSEDHEAVRQELVASGVDVAAARLAGDYLPVDSAHLVDDLMKTSGVDVPALEGLVEGLLASAADRGRDLRLCGDVHSRLWEQGHHAPALELEAFWQRLHDESSFPVLCLYASHLFHAKLDGDPFVAVCEQHTTVAPVEDYASLVDPGDQRSLALIEQQGRANLRTSQELASRVQEIESELDRAVHEIDKLRDQFEQAVASRDVIGQAKGIIMVRWRIDADTAFAMLRDASSRSHRKLRDVAEAVVRQQLGMI